MRKTSFGLVVGITLTALSTAVDAGTPDKQTATWTPQSVNFTYTGFTSNYSCNGLQHLLRKTLVALGARNKGLSLETYNCGIDTDRPTRAPRVKLKFETLQPANSAATNAEQAQWTAVNVGRVADFERGDCELVEQIQQQILPKFTTRNVKASASCIPNQAATGTPGLRLDVLKVDQPRT